MTDPIEPTPMDETDKPHRIIVVMGNHSLGLVSSLRRLHLMAALQVIVLTQNDADRRDVLEINDGVSPLNRAIDDIVLRHTPVEIPMLRLVEPRDICTDYNARAAMAPLAQDRGMAVKAHLATDRMAAKSIRYRHFHY